MHKKVSLLLPQSTYKHRSHPSATALIREDPEDPLSNSGRLSERVKHKVFDTCSRKMGSTIGLASPKCVLAITWTIWLRLKFWRRGSAWFFCAHLFGFWPLGPMFAAGTHFLVPGAQIWARAQNMVPIWGWAQTRSPILGLGPKYGPRFAPGPKIWALHPKRNQGSPQG